MKKLIHIFLNIYAIVHLFNLTLIFLIVSWELLKGPLKFADKYKVHTTFILRREKI